MEAKQKIGFYERRADWTETVLEYKRRFNNLILSLGESCQEVSRQLVQEHDADVPPGDFIRDGRVEFIFPKQPGAVSFDNSKDIDPNPSYRLHRVDTGIDFDTSQVSGHIEVVYDDAGTRPMLQVIDKMPGQDSQLPPEALAAIEAAFSD
jgi:hypothetical protein